MAGRSSRRGAALVAALALLALAAALLGGAFAVAGAAALSARSTRAGIAAEGAARAALAERLAGWSAAEDGLRVGGSASRLVQMAPSAAPISGSTQVLRLSDATFLVLVDVVSGEPAAPLARRRLRLVVSAPAPDSGGARGSPVPIARWSLGDLY